jgi:uncharacterized RDD family membrane protein YckC
MESPNLPPAPPPSYDAPGSSGGSERASFGQRLVAVIIDGIIVGIPFYVLFLVAKGAGYALGLVLSVAYTVYFEGGESGQTIGKKVMNIRVSDAHSGGAIGYSKAFIRWVGKIVSGIPCYLGYLWMLWDKDKQTWHDKIASTYVTKV